MVKLAIPTPGQSPKSTTPPRAAAAPVVAVAKQSVAKRTFDAHKLGVPEPTWKDAIFGAYQQHPRLFYGIVAAVAAVAAVLVILIFFVHHPKFVGDFVRVEITGPEKVTNDGDVLFTITLRNDEEVALAASDLLLVAPDGFTLVTSSLGTKEPNKAEWDTGVFAPGQEKTITVSGTLSGQEGLAKTVEAVWSFKPKGISTVFEERSQTSVVIGQPSLVVGVDTPKSSASGNKVTYVVTYKNTTEKVIDNVQVRVTYPEGFTVDKVTPTAQSQQKNTWLFPHLAAGAQAQIEIEGSLRGQDGESKRVTAAIGTLEANNSFIQIAQESDITTIIALSLSLDLSVKGKTNIIVSPGQRIEGTVHYTNTGDAAIRNLVVTTSFDKTLVDESHIVAQDGTYKDGVITWSGSGVAGLSVVQPKDQGTLTFSVPIKSEIPATSHRDNNFTLTMQSAIFSGDLSAEERVTKQVKSNEVAAKINTVIVDDTYGTYASGALPPQVGQDTVYTIHYSLVNFTNDVQDTAINATLAPGVTWVGNVHAASGTLTFNEATNKVSWNIGLLPANTGRSGTSLTADFQIMLNPGPNTVDTRPVLLKDIALVGTDAFTGTNLGRTIENITTDLPNDPNARGKDRVVP